MGSSRESFIITFDFALKCLETKNLHSSWKQVEVVVTNSVWGDEASVSTN